MELVYDGLYVAKLKASFALDKNARLFIYQWIESLCYPDRYALNISKLVNLEDDKLYRMKSHDCHMFVQTLIPFAYRNILPKRIWDALMKINYCFRDICSNKLHTQHMKKLEIIIVQIIYKLEMIFPSSLFGSMK